MNNITNIGSVNRVNDEAVTLIEELLAMTKSGEVTGVFVVGMTTDNKYRSDMTENMNTFAGRGMVASAVTESLVSNIVDPDEPPSNVS